MKRFSQDWGPRRIRAWRGSPPFRGSPHPMARVRGRGRTPRWGGPAFEPHPSRATLSHGVALADLTDFRGPGSKKSIFPKYLRTVGESKERHGGPNGSPWDPPSPGIDPGTPPHTQPEVWPIFMFWAHQGPCGPQGTGPFWAPKIDFFKICRNWWGILKDRHGGPNGSPWDPPSPGIDPGTPPHTQA